MALWGGTCCIFELEDTQVQQTLCNAFTLYEQIRLGSNNMLLEVICIVCYVVGTIKGKVWIVFHEVFTGNTDTHTYTHTRLS